MRVLLPPPPPNFPYMAQLLAVLRRIVSAAISQDEAAARVILQAPDETTWAVTVSNAGALVVTAIDGKSRV